MSNRPDEALRDLNAKRTIAEQKLIDQAGTTLSFLQAVLAERNYQDRKWGAPPLHIHSPAEWALVLTKEFGEAIEGFYGLSWPLLAVGDTAEEQRILLRRELVQVAAVCCAISEELDALS